MDEQKKNRVAAAVTVNVIVLVAILVAVIIYQLAEIVIFNALKNELLSEIAKYEQLIEQGETDLEYLQSEQYLLDLALKLGYTFPKD